MTEEQMDALAAQYGGVKVGGSQPNVEALAAQYGGTPVKEAPKGFLDRVGEDLKKRSIMSEQITQAMRSGQQGPTESGFQQLGNVYAGGLNDIIGEGLTSAGRTISDITPQAIKDPVNRLHEFVYDSSLGQGIRNTAGQGAEAYQGFAQENPRAARNIESVANIVPLVTPVKGKTVAGVTADTAIQGVKTPVKGAVNQAKTATAGFLARSPEALDQVSAALKQKSNEIYKMARESGAVVKSKSNSDIFNKIQNAVESSGKMNKDLHRNTLSVLEDIKTASGKDIGLEELEQYRSLLGDVVNKGTDLTGKLDADAFKASRAIDALDDAIDKIEPKDLLKGDTAASKAFQAGREQWKQYRKFDSVAEVLRKADGDPNRIKSGLQRFVNNKKNLRGFNVEEKKALLNAASNSTSEKLLKMFGKFGIDLGTSLTPGNTTLPAIAGWLGSPYLVAGGTVARQGQKYLARGKAEKALKLIESGGR